MNGHSSRAPRWRRFFALAVLAVCTAFLGSAAARAQDRTYMLRFSTKQGDTTPGASLLLRPNLTQNFFVYVDNLQGKAGMVKVELRAAGKAIEGGTVSLPIQATQKITPVLFGKKETPPAKPTATTATPVAPPKLTELKGTLQVFLLDAATNKELDKATLKVAEPKDYFDDPKVTFDPKPAGGKKNQLRVELRAKQDTFSGPPCRVELVLDPKRIPGLIDNKTSGSRSGLLMAPGAKLTLTADDLDFKTNADVSGMVYLTIDGWQRAFAYNTTFSRTGTGTAARINSPVVRLIAPRVWNPAKPLPVKLEADNLDDQEVLELGFDRDGDGNFSKLNGEIQTFIGSRQEQINFNPAFPGGALQLMPVVKDWTTELDVKDVFGARDLRVRLLTAEGKLDERLNRAFSPKEPVTELRQTVVLDGNPPAGVKFIKLPKKLPRGEPLPVSAVCADPKGIKEVLFFVGKPGPDGKVPPNAIQAVGQLSDKDKGIWSASLEAPTDQKGKFDITVQFVKFTGLVAMDTMKIELVDPAKQATNKAKASIEGKVTDVGGLPQGMGIPVELRDEKGNVKDATKTDEKSNYIFKDVPPGSYRITAVRTGTATKGATMVGVQAGDKKTNVDVKLSR